jgi:hypothetical protein
MTGDDSEARRDDPLLDRLPSDVAPRSVTEMAKSAFTTRRGGPVAALVFDSLVDSDDHRDDHRLRFEHDDLVVEVEVSAGDRVTDLAGEVRPPSATRAVLEFRDAAGLAMVAAVDGGRFAFCPVAPGLVRISLEGIPDVAVISSDWFRV